MAIECSRVGGNCQPGTRGSVHRLPRCPRWPRSRQRPDCRRTTADEIGRTDTNVTLCGGGSFRETSRQRESDDVDANGFGDVAVSGGGGAVFHWGPIR